MLLIFCAKNDLNYLLIKQKGMAATDKQELWAFSVETCAEGHVSLTGDLAADLGDIIWGSK